MISLVTGATGFIGSAVARRLVAAGHCVKVLVRPSSPRGNLDGVECGVAVGDLKPTPTGRMVLQAAAGSMPAYIDTGLNVVHVDDVAEGHLLAFERGRVGERYILGGENLSLHAILKCVARESGCTPPRIRLPRRPLFPIAYAMEAWARHASSKEPMMTVDSLRMAAKHMYFSSNKAREELGFAPRPAEEAIHDAVSWFRYNGYLH